MSQYIDIIFFVIIAVFLFLKLRNTFGEIDEDNGGLQNLSRDGKNDAYDTTAIQTDAGIIKKISASSAVADALRSMQARDGGFEIQPFLKSAETAYRMIIRAYVTGDRRTLRMLLSPEIFKRFETEIENREKEGRIIEISIKEVKKIEITDVDVRERFTKIEILFTAEEVAFTRDAAGKTVSGNVTDVVTVTDRWVFEKQTDNTDPTWYLVDTLDEIDEAV